MRDIDAEEEITFDYAMADSSPIDEFDCECGAAACRRRVTGSDWLLPRLHRAYGVENFSLYLQKKIRRLQPAEPTTTAQ